MPKLLVIDEDASHAHELAGQFAQFGIGVTVEAEERQALHIAQQARPDAILLEIRWSHANGLALIQALRAAAPEAQLIVLTGCTELAAVVNAIKLGACNYFAKPADIHGVLAALGWSGMNNAPTQAMPPRTVKELEGQYLLGVLQRHGGNVSATARALRMHRRTLQRKLARHTPLGQCGDLSLPGQHPGR